MIEEERRLDRVYVASSVRLADGVMTALTDTDMKVAMARK